MHGNFEGNEIPGRCRGWKLNGERGKVKKIKKDAGNWLSIPWEFLRNFLEIFPEL